MDEIGSTLREARMRARIDISEVEARTKIRAKYLRAIENEEWDLLPGPVYTKSFLRTYSDYLGLDSRMLIDDYKRRYERPSDHEVRPISAPRRGDGQFRPRGPVVPPWAAIAAVVLVILVVLYLVGRNNTKTPSTTGTHAKTTHHATHTPPMHTTPAALTPAPATQPVTLQLVPTSAVYVCLVDGAGRKLIPGQIFNAGQTIPTQTARKLLLTLGNASVQMKIDGQPVTVAPSASSIGYEMSPTEHHLLAPVKQPTCR
jgi:cytoskeleton protein RodZ